MPSARRRREWTARGGKFSVVFVIKLVADLDQDIDLQFKIIRHSGTVNVIDGKRSGGLSKIGVSTPEVSIAVNLYLEDSRHIHLQTVSLIITPCVIHIILRTKVTKEPFLMQCGVLRQARQPRI